MASALFIAFAGCNSNGSSDKAAERDTTNAAGMTNPSAIDTTQHPNGMTNGDVISTDTAAMNVQKSIDKGKAAKKDK